MKHIWVNPDGFGKIIKIPGFSNDENIVSSLEFLWRNMDKPDGATVDFFPKSSNHGIHITRLKILGIVDVEHTVCDFLVDGIRVRYLKELDCMAFAYHKCKGAHSFLTRKNIKIGNPTYLTSRTIDWETFGQKLKLLAIKMI